jgi:hypothetical protein
MQSTGARVPKIRDFDHSATASAACMSPVSFRAGKREVAYLEAPHIAALNFSGCFDLINSPTVLKQAVIVLNVYHGLRFAERAYESRIFAPGVCNTRRTSYRISV